MSNRTNLNALLLMSVFLLAMVGTTFAEPLFPFQVGQQYEFHKWDSDDPVNEWAVHVEVKSQVTYNSVDYFQFQVWNYDNDSAFKDLYWRSTEEALYGYNPGGADYLEFQKAPVGTAWSFYRPDGTGLDYQFIEIVAVEPVTVPFGTFDTAYIHRNNQCENSDGSGTKSPYWYEWIVPSMGIVKEFDYWVDNPPATMELVDVTSVAEEALDIERIGMCSQKDHLDGTAPINPWRFEVDIHLVDPGTLHHIDVTLPTGGMTSFTIYEDSGDWEYHSSPTLYPTLTALQAVYPTGLYTFDFRDISNVQLNYVELNYSDIDEPDSPVDFTYPNDNGQTGISTNPTLTWTVNSGAGDCLGMGVKDDYDDIMIYENVPGTMETLSWQPGPLDTEQNYWLYVTVVRVKDWAGGPGWPTKTVGGDEFEYLLHIGYCNKIGFTTGEPPELTTSIDIDPDTLNLKSKGNWITCYIELPDGYDVGNIDVGSILMEYLLEVQHSDVQDDMLMVKFDRQDVIAYIALVLEIELPADVTLMVTGELTDGTPFEGSDTIRVIDEGKNKESKGMNKK